MNIIDKIKLLLTTRGIVKDEIKEAKMQTASGKPGWKTTEFWVKVLTVDLPTFYVAIKGFIPPKDALIIEAIAGAIYGIYRTTAKAVADVKTASAS